MNPASGAQAVLATDEVLLEDPADVAVVPSTGQIWLVDDGGLGTGGLLKVDPVSGAIVPFVTGSPLQEPKGIAIAPSGRIYITDFMTDTLHSVDPVSGALSTVATGPAV